VRCIWKKIQLKIDVKNGKEKEKIIITRHIQILKRILRRTGHFLD